MSEPICERCGKPDPAEAVAAQQEAMNPRTVKSGYALLAVRDAFLPVAEQPLPDVRMGDIVRVELIAGAVPDVTAGFYCECAEDAA